MIEKRGAVAGAPGHVERAVATSGRRGLQQQGEGPRRQQPPAVGGPRCGQILIDVGEVHQRWLRSVRAEPGRRPPGALRVGHVGGPQPPRVDHAQPLVQPIRRHSRFPDFDRPEVGALGRKCRDGFGGLARNRTGVQGFAVGFPAFF